MGGGGGSTAREALKHKGLEKVVMRDIDEASLAARMRACLPANQEVFRDKKLHLIINDAKAELENSIEKFDVIMGDLSDPVEGGPCNQHYTKCFYAQVVKPKLKDNCIFVTQAGPAGVLSHRKVFTSVNNTIKQVFKNVLTFTAHVPSYAETWGWVMAADQPFNLDPLHIDNGIKERITGELCYLDGACILSSSIMNKFVYSSLLKETHVLTEENAKFIPGHRITYPA
ncbi:hypothetical protein L1049_023082 [Liquidambar formosana]|uniref:PABS domain-containing protein n=1 Tax=Liquidambar formosana TaxID=63359 RepID=A0AAP0RDJ9_LIQFO